MAESPKRRRTIGDRLRGTNRPKQSPPIESARESIEVPPSDQVAGMPPETTKAPAEKATPTKSGPPAPPKSPTTDSPATPPLPDARIPDSALTKEELAARHAAKVAAAAKVAKAQDRADPRVKDSELTPDELAQRKKDREIQQAEKAKLPDERIPDSDLKPAERKARADYKAKYPLGDIPENGVRLTPAANKPVSKFQAKADAINAQRQQNAPDKDKADAELTPQERFYRDLAEDAPVTAEQLEARHNRNRRTAIIAGAIVGGVAVTGAIVGVANSEQNDGFSPPPNDPTTGQGDPATPAVTTTPAPVASTASPAPTVAPTYPTTTKAVTKTVPKTKLYLSEESYLTDGVTVTAKIKYDPKNKTVEVVDGQGTDWYYNNADTKQMGASQPLVGDKAYAPTDLEVTDLETGQMTVYPLDVNQSATTDKSITQSFSTGPIKLSDGSKDLSITYDTPDDPGSNIKSVKIGEVDFGL